MANNKSYIAPEPKYGDQRYQKLEDKKSLDMLRVLYYELFRKDPSINPIVKISMFDDTTLPIYTSSYLVRGEIPFNIMYTNTYDDYKANDKLAIGIQFELKTLEKEIASKYMELINLLIEKYTNNNINLMCCDADSKNCTVAYISDDSFEYHYGTNEKMYYDFFLRLCDNMYRNIVYIGQTMKLKASKEEISKVEEDFVMKHKEIIANMTNVSLNELNNSNEKLCNKVLRLR